MSLTGRSHRLRIRVKYRVLLTVALMASMYSDLWSQNPVSTDTPIGIQVALLTAQSTLETVAREAAVATTNALDVELLPPPPNVGNHLQPRIPIPIQHGPYRGQLDQYRVRAAEISDAGMGTATDLTLPVVSEEIWWQEMVAGPIGLSGKALPVDINGLTQTALACSPLVKSILTEPRIRRSDLVIADADFDTVAFIEGNFADTNEPVGSLLTTGNDATRFRDQTFASAAGLRKRARAGGALELVQRGGFQANNSSLLDPNPQGTTRLEVNFTQPLLKDHGRAVNNTRVLLAQIDIELAKSDVRAELEKHLVDVTRAYWDLFGARAGWLQRNRLLQGAIDLHGILVARDQVDSLKRQILRAEVAVASRRSDLIRAETKIRNAQARLRVLTGDPRLIQRAAWELTPQESPLSVPVKLSTKEATITALDNRPDIARSIRKIQAVSARVGAARNQVLPRLDMILSTYVAGLDSRRDTFGAFVNQFSDGRPSYAAGLLFEVPLGNRASRARLERSRWELTRAMYEFQQTTDVAFTEVEVAVRETQTALGEMVTKQQAIEAASHEVSYLNQRWKLLPDPSESAVLLIENLLDAQERLADEERGFVQAQMAYAMSWVQLRQAMGVLLRFESVPGDCVFVADEDMNAGAERR
ncbi:MAG: TolC family protein [Planctomycetaceae bacterium]|nr:TolC family protein [Planctomycetaceae bacterium]